MGPPDRACAVSVVIPTYNEAARIGGSLVPLDRHLQAHVPGAEIVIVDDGSTDDTIAVVRRHAAALATPVRVIACTPNRGKGFAVRTGMLAAGGHVVVTMDADLATPLEEMAKLLTAVQDGAAVASGSRRMPGAAVEVHQPYLREQMGRVFTWLANRLVVEATDVTCGFKAFTRAAAQAVFRRLTLDDWSYDAELLFVARRLGFVVREVPVRWHDVEGTKVRRSSAAARALAGLLRIRWNALRGRYDGPAADPPAS